MFRTVPLSTIRSFSLYTQQWYMSYSFGDSLRAGSGKNWSCSQAVSKFVWHILLLCTVKNSWWWIEELSETCRVSFLKWIWGISASSWFYYKNLSKWTVNWTSNAFYLVLSLPNRIELLFSLYYIAEKNALNTRIHIFR